MMALCTSCGLKCIQFQMQCLAMWTQRCCVLVTHWGYEISACSLEFNFRGGDKTWGRLKKDSDKALAAAAPVVRISCGIWVKCRRDMSIWFSQRKSFWFSSITYCRTKTWFLTDFSHNVRNYSVYPTAVFLKKHHLNNGFWIMFAIVRSH